MKTRINQIYEDYWNYTAAFTNFNGKLFIGVLSTCIEFIDSWRNEPYSPDKNKRSQLFLQDRYPSTAKEEEDRLITQRKRWNQLVKLGFIRPFLDGYPDETKDYISAKTERKRKSILSKIVYKYANFLNSTTNDIRTEQLAFFIKSLEEVGSISEKQLATLMTIDIKKFGKDCVTEDDLEWQYANYDVEGFYKRKYNQVQHLKNVLGKLEDLALLDGVLYFREDISQLLSDKESKKEVRDPYLQRIYKSELEDESMTQLLSSIPKCMLEGLSYPVLIASHIKPYIRCNASEAFDVNNGLLLSKNVDSLFDLGYITFNDDGSIVTAKDLSQDVAIHIKEYHLPDCFINKSRMDYMKYHRSNVFEKRYNSYSAKHYVLGTV